MQLKNTKSIKYKNNNISMKNSYQQFIQLYTKVFTHL